MNRALLTSAAAAAGVTGVLVLAPHLSPATASASTGNPGSTTAGSGSKGSSGSSGSGGSGSSSGSSGSGGSGASSRSGTVTGDVAQQQFGPIQVQITVSKGTITDVQVVQTPSDGRSRWINNQAVPILVSQALQAQSASIDGVSGATLTSRAFVTSLASAIQKAGL